MTDVVNGILSEEVLVVREFSANFFPCLVAGSGFWARQPISPLPTYLRRRGQGGGNSQAGRGSYRIFGYERDGEQDGRKGAGLLERVEREEGAGDAADGVDCGRGIGAGGARGTGNRRAAKGAGDQGDS